MDIDDKHIEAKLNALIGNSSPFKVPHLYFEELSESIQGQVNNDFLDTKDLPQELTTESPFTLPDFYFENVTNQVIAKIGEKSFESKLTSLEESGLLVHDDYFEQSFESILNKTVGANIEHKIKPLVIWRKYASIAAVFILTFSLSYWIYQSNKTEETNIEVAEVPSFENVNSNDILETLKNEEIGDEVYSLASIDEVDLYDKKEVTKDKTKTSDSVNSEKEIEQFLIDHIDELDEI
ncbi:MAG: hypothetical protein HYZ42_04750 [Bacteroidetes bacterium]|nr:hypothetical protein [Bacteroidota bacterium]